MIFKIKQILWSVLLTDQWLRQIMLKIEQPNLKMMDFMQGITEEVETNSWKFRWKMEN